jgi:hypothetical protein
MSQMNKLFQGLSYTMPDEDKFAILKRNVKPSHRLGIALLKVQNLHDLRDACRCLDSMDSSLYSLATDSPGQRPVVQNQKQISEIEQPGPSEPSQQKDEQTVKKKGKSKKKKKVEAEKSVAELSGDRPERNFRNSGRNDDAQGESARRFHKPFFKNRGHQNQWSKNQPVERPNNGMDDFSKNMSEFLRDWSNEVLRQKPVEGKKLNFPNTDAPEFKPSTQTRVNPVNKNQQTVCWNCDGLNHHQRFCTAPRQVICFGCGKKGVYRDQCPNCSGNAK